MLPRVVLEGGWRPLGGALGRPREAQEGPKSMLGGCFFEVEKALAKQVVLEAVFARFGSLLEEQKLAFRIGGVAKIRFSGSCVFTSS